MITLFYMKELIKYKLGLRVLLKPELISVKKQVFHTNSYNRYRPQNSDEF